MGTFRAAVLAALGHAPDVIEPGRLQRFSTCGRPADDAGWCILFNDLRAGAFGCHRQGVSESWRAADCTPMTRAGRVELHRLQAASQADRQARQHREWARNARHISEVWGQGIKLVAGDPCALYMARRGIGGVQGLPALLRLHPGLPYWHEGKTLGTFPTMLAPLIAPDGRMVALHRTFLTVDGRKAAVPSPKKLTRTAGLLTGAGIPLCQPERGCIGIAEGIETALAARCVFGVPTAAAYSADSLSTWRWPAGLHRLVVFADNDARGRDAADILRARALAAGLSCDVVTPSEPGADWCDVWAARGAVLIRSGGAS